MVSSNNASLLDSKYINSEDDDYETEEVGGYEEHGDAGMCMALFFYT